MSIYSKELTNAMSDDDWRNFQKSIPEEHISKIYDRDDNVLFGSKMTKGKVSYNYIKPELVKENKPIFLYSSVSYDGKGNKDLPANTDVRKFEDVKKYLES